MPKAPMQQELSSAEMAQAQQHGKSLIGEPTDFDQAVESHLATHYPKEFSAAKMHAAQTSGGDVGLGPSSMDTAAIKSRNAAQQQTATQGAQQAAQTQAQQSPVNAPEAPSGPVGTTTPYPAQRAPQPPPSATQGLPQAPAAPGPEEEQGPPQ